MFLLLSVSVSLLLYFLFSFWFENFVTFVFPSWTRSLSRTLYLHRFILIRFIFHMAIFLLMHEIIPFRFMHIINTIQQFTLSHQDWKSENEKTRMLKRYREWVNACSLYNCVCLRLLLVARSSYVFNVKQPSKKKISRKLKYKIKHWTNRTSEHNVTTKTKYSWPNTGNTHRSFAHGEKNGTKAELNSHIRNLIQPHTVRQRVGYIRHSIRLKLR